MDDFSVTSLTESQNEWCARLVSILTPLIIGVFKSIFDEAWKLCAENDEEGKYLMTFQNFIARITKWNPAMIKDETTRIKESSGCGYLEELVTCVHIIKLKSLTCARVGQKQKKISVNVPPLEDFIHKIYINCARKIYTNVYLFDKTCSPLQIQKHNRELELIVKECILLTIRESIPVEQLLRAYLDETQETDVEVEEKEEIIETEIPPEELPSVSHSPDHDMNSVKIGGNEANGIAEENEVQDYKDKLKFNHTDYVMDNRGVETTINAPKTIDRLEELSVMHYKKRAEVEAAESEDDSERLNIGDDISLDTFDVFDVNKPTVLNDDPLIDVEIL
jgi:hypothetical protein